MGQLKLVIFILFISSNCCSATEYRLPEIVTPTLYEVFLTIDPDSTDYSGIANITVRSSNFTKDIHIHGDTNFVQIGTIILNNNAKCTIEDLGVAQIQKISCSRSLIIDEDNTLYIEFTAKFSTEDGYGLFKTTYEDKGSKQIIIESNFKPIFARRAFPCLDEPDFKAGFVLEITHPKGYTVLSNSPVVQTTNVSDDTETTKFGSTPKISTYLFSISISKFQERRTSSENGVAFKIFTKSEDTTLTSHVANEYYHKIIQKLDNYTGIKYQNLNETESYFIAVPDYVDAMGDFGLFTYREADLLDEGDKTSNRVKQNIITTMAYKLSHEWFGGDVSTKWWSDVWANEAVATYLKYIIPHEVDDQLELENQFILEVNQKILQYDAYPFAQPLSPKQANINKDWLVENEVNSINYEKGASILKMINTVLGGKENLQEALQSHLKNRQETETDGIDMLKDLVEGKGDGDVDYFTYLENWILLPGYPLITAKFEKDNVTSIASLTQKRFLYPTSETTDDDTLWFVPLVSGIQTNPSDLRVYVFIEPNENMYDFFGDMWIMFNNRGGCFYRVNYDDELWGRLLDGLHSGREDFHVLERTQLIDDIFNIARIGDVNYSLAFQFADTLVNETDYYPWYAAFNVFSYLLGKMEYEEIESNLKNYILNLMENVIVIPNDKFIDDNDTHVSILKKVMVLEWACKLGHTDCIKYATDKFKSYKASQGSLDDYNARGIIFCNGIRHSLNTREDSEFLWNIYINSTSVHEQNDVLNALGCLEDQGLLPFYLQKIINVDSNIKRQDALVVFKSVFSSSLGLEVAKEFLENHLSDVQNFFKDMRILSEMIYAVAEKLMTDDDIEWLKDLLSNELLDDYEDVRSKAEILASVNNFWQKNYQADVTNIFPSSSTSTSSTSSTTSTTKPPTTTEPSTTTESNSEKLSGSKYVVYFVLVIITVINLS